MPDSRFTSRGSSGGGSAFPFFAAKIGSKKRKEEEAEPIRFGTRTGKTATGTQFQYADDYGGIPSERLPIKAPTPDYEPKVPTRLVFPSVYGLQTEEQYASNIRENVRRMQVNPALSQLPVTRPNDRTQRRLDAAIVNPPERPMFGKAVEDAMRVSIQENLIDNVNRVSRGVATTGADLIRLGSWVTSRGREPEMADKIDAWVESMRPEEMEFIDYLGEGAGSMLTFFIPGMGIEKGASVLARVSPLAARTFGAVGSAFLEAGVESGSVYDEVLELGGTTKEAEMAAFRTFILNSMLVSVTNRLGIFGDKAKVWKAALDGMGMEGLQEYFQQVLSNTSGLESNARFNLQNTRTGRAWDEGALDAGFIGGVWGAVGGGVGGATRGRMEMTPQERIEENRRTGYHKQLALMHIQNMGRDGLVSENRLARLTGGEEAMRRAGQEGRAPEPVAGGEGAPVSRGDYQQFELGEIAVEPASFQFRKGIDKTWGFEEENVTRILEEGFKPGKLDPIKVAEYEEGGEIKRVLVDGHNRLEVLKREGITTTLGEVLRFENKGQAVKYARIVNQTGKLPDVGSRVETAKAMIGEGRTVKQVAGEMGGVKESEVQQLLNIGQLDAKVQEQVSQGTLDPKLAGVLGGYAGQMKMTPELQTQMVDMIREDRFTPTRLKSYLEAVAPAAMKTVEQKGLFGVEDIPVGFQEVEKELEDRRLELKRRRHSLKEAAKLEKELGPEVIATIEEKAAETEKDYDALKYLLATQAPGITVKLPKGVTQERVDKVRQDVFGRRVFEEVTREPEPRLAPVVEQPVVPEEAPEARMAVTPPVLPPVSIESIEGAPEGNNLAKVKKQIVEPQREKFTVKRGIEKIGSVMHDTNIGLRKIRDMAEKAKGEELAYMRDPYELSMLLKGTDAVANIGVYKGQIDYDTGLIRDDVRPYQDIVRELQNKQVMEDFDGYLYASVAIDRHGQGKEPGIAKDVAEKAIQEAEAKYPAFPRLKKDIQDFVKADRDYLLASGAISQDMYDYMEAANPEYAPLHRAIDESIKLNNDLKGQVLGAADKAASLLRFKGSKLPIYSPLSSILKNHYSFIGFARQNAVKQALVQAVQGAPEMDGVIVKMKRKPSVTTLSRESIAKQLGIDEYIIDEKFEEMVTIFASPKPPRGGMRVLEKGEATYYDVGDASLREAIESMNSEELRVLHKILKWPSLPVKVLRGGAVLAPGFSMGTNPFRDQFQAAILSRGNYIPFIDFLPGLHAALTESNEYLRIVAQGAEQSQFIAEDRPALERQVKDLMKYRERSALYKITHPLATATNFVEVLRLISQYSEAGTRGGEGLKVLAKAEREGVAPREAATQAAASFRRVTTDFGQKGWLGHAMNKIVAFWNPAVQDPVKFYREFISGTEKGANRGRAWLKASILVTVPNIIAYMMSKDDEKYQELPLWRKSLFLNFSAPQAVTDVIGWEIISLPQPFLIHQIFGRLPVVVMEANDKQSTEPFEEYFDHFMESQAPGWFPTALKPMSEAAHNYSEFYGAQIDPMRDQNYLPPDRYGVFTTETSKALANFYAQLPAPIHDIVENLTGIKEMSPRKIDFLVYSHMAGLGRYGLLMADVVLGKVDILPEKNQLPLRVDRIPVLDRFGVTDLEMQSASVNEFYELYGRANDARKSWDKNMEAKNMDRLKVMGRKNLSELFVMSPTGELDPLYNSMTAPAEALSGLSKAKRAAMENDELTPEQRETILENANVMMSRIARAALKSIENRPETIEDLTRMLEEVTSGEAGVSSPRMAPPTTAPTPRYTPPATPPARFRGKNITATGVEFTPIK